MSHVPCLYSHLTYSHCGAVFADASVQDDVEVVVAGVERPADDAQDGEDVELQSDDGQLYGDKRGSN